MLKKTILLAAGMCLLTFLEAQTWKTQIYSLSGKSKVKIMKIKPQMQIDIRSLLLDNDSLRLTTKYDGSFLGVSGDSMKIKLTNFYEFRNYTDGTFKQTTIPGKSYLMPGSLDKGLASIPLSDINYVSYSHRDLGKTSDVVETGVYVSIIVMILSPFICYNYKDREFNSERYKYWGLGSTIGLTASFCLIMATNKSKDYQFKTNWPNKKKKVWSFEKGF